MAGVEGAARRRAGDVERAVRRDLRQLDGEAKSRRATMIELALVLARALDARAAAEGSPAVLAKLVQELRAVMGRLMEVKGDDNDADEFAARMSSPVRLAAVPGAGDVGSAGGGDRAAAG